MGIANGGSTKKSCADISASASRIDCSDVGSTVMTNGRSRAVIVRQLQNRFQADLLRRERAGQARDDSRLVHYAESQIVGRVLQGHRDRLVLAQAFMREG